jgi:2'-5' RNA ligase
VPRLFTAIELPTAIVQHLSMLRAHLAGARWIDPDNYHLTLRFVGDIERPSADDFAEALSAIRCPAFSLKLDGLGSFGGRRPRALWAGVAPSEPLMLLQRAHERSARSAGLEAETRNFTPHVTLARLHGTRPWDIADYLGAFGGFRTPAFPVDRFVLLSARESTGGGPYLLEESFDLLSPDAHKAERA